MRNLCQMIKRKIGRNIWISVALVAIGCGSSGTGSIAAEQTFVLQPTFRSLTAQASLSVVVVPDTSDPIESLSELVSIPRDLRLRPGQSQRISATGFGTLGQVLEGLEFRWAIRERLAGSFETLSSDGSLIEFTAGKFVAKYPGAIVLIGLQTTAGDARELRFVIDVDLVPPDDSQSLSYVESITGEIVATHGQLLRLQAVGYDALGRIIPQTRLDWTVTDPGLGSIIAPSLFEVDASPGSYAGALVLRGILDDVVVETSLDLVVLGGLGAHARLRAFVIPVNFVAKPGEEHQLEGIVLDGNGQAVSVRSVRWVVENGAIGTLDQNGLFRAGPNEGIFVNSILYEATVGDQLLEARSTVTIDARKPSRLEEVSVRPNSIVLQNGQFSFFSLLARDEKGGVPLVERHWELTDNSVGVVNDIGLFVASGKPGFYPRALRGIATQTLAEASIEADAYADITITGELDSVVIVPDQLVIGTKNSKLLSAVSLDKNGVAIPGVIIEWSILDSALGTVDINGLFQAGFIPGEYIDGIRATAIQRISE